MYATGPNISLKQIFVWASNRPFLFLDVKHLISFLDIRGFSWYNELSN